MSAGDVIVAIAAPIRRLDKLSFAAPLKDVLTIMQDATADNFRREQDPAGNPWAPLKRKYAKSKKILVDTGDLKESVTRAGAKGSVARITRTKLEFGTEIPYGRYHQHGTKRMARRQFVGVNDAILEKIERVFAEWVRWRILRDAEGRFKEHPE